MALQAASLTAWGGSLSGMPWARLIAPWRLARRVISRICDSPKYCTRSDSIRLLWVCLILNNPRGTGKLILRMRRTAWVVKFIFSPELPDGRFQSYIETKGIDLDRAS